MEMNPQTNQRKQICQINKYSKGIINNKHKIESFWNSPKADKRSSIKKKLKEKEHEKESQRYNIIYKDDVLSDRYTDYFSNDSSEHNYDDSRIYVEEKKPNPESQNVSKLTIGDITEKINYIEG